MALYALLIRLVGNHRKFQKPAHEILNEIPFKSRIKIPVPAWFAYSRLSFLSWNTDACFASPIADGMAHSPTKQKIYKKKVVSLFLLTNYLFSFL